MKPRYYYRRLATRILGRGLQTLFTRTTITGLEHVPAQGPYIAVGNHDAGMEVALMVINLPHIVDLIGNGDVPLDPIYGKIALWYGFIPVRRGYVDRTALKAAQAVLERGGVLGVFPEGGIWEQSSGAARPGVAWLSQQTGAPILPIGFSGVIGAVNRAVRLKRPQMTMRIGPLMPAVPNSDSPRARKTAIEEASRDMMRRIADLIPPNPEAEKDRIVEEHYTFRIELQRPDGSLVEDVPVVPYGEDLGYFFHHAVLLEVIYHNYRLTGAKPLAHYADLTDPAQLGAALEVALRFYETETAFLGYRLGYARAGRILEGLRALRDVFASAAVQEYRIRLLPERTIIRAGGKSESFFRPSVKREF